VEHLSNKLKTSIALQLWTVRYSLVQDPRDTLKKVRDMGYTAIETAPFPPELDAATVAEISRSIDLPVVAIHCDLPQADACKKIVETARLFNCERIIWHGWPRDDMHDSIEGIKRLAHRYNEASRIAIDQGLSFGLHNHWWEFESMDGRLPFDILNELLDPRIFWELDIYWAQTAGVDPVAIIQQNRNRISMLHLKDGPAEKGKAMTALGEGVLDLNRILKTAGPDVERVVELDECETDMFVALEKSLAFLATL